MTKRTVMIFPKFNNMGIIDEIRHKHDPLANKVRPHITLVFPFDSSISKEDLKEHIVKATKKIKPFKLSLRKVVPGYGNYLFLQLSEGKVEVEKLHKILYQDLLEHYYPIWLKNVQYIPHLTLGRIEDDEEFKKAVKGYEDVKDIFTTTVDKISVEIIGDNEESIIELEVPLL